MFIYFLMIAGTWGVSLSSAQKSYDIKKMTLEVKTSLDSRRARFDALKMLKEKGAVGENNQGYIDALVKDSESESMAQAENKDRQFIYMTILEQNNLPQDSLKTIETVFAQVQRDKANPGDKIQDENGQWSTK